MDRNTWLREKRRETEMQYNTIWAPHYGEKYGVYSNLTHQAFIKKFLRFLPHPSMILDAACGAGRYFPLLLGTGRTVVGVDQSQGMLDRAKTRYSNILLEKVGLQEMTFSETFDGVICMDAMEHVGPEDWPITLANFSEALKSKGFLYFTVEAADESRNQESLYPRRKAGLPVIMGEWPDGDCYHYYPSMQLVKGWVNQAGFEMVEELEGDGYHHFIVRKAK